MLGCATNRDSTACDFTVDEILLLQENPTQSGQLVFLFFKINFLLEGNILTWNYIPLNWNRNYSRTKCNFTATSTAARNPEQYFNCRDETKSNAET